MKRLRMPFLFVVAFCLVFLSFQQESRALSSGSAAKDLKRTAHRLRISVEQLKKAQRVLQEATDLARQIKPFPASQVFSLAESWRQLNHSKAKEVINSFIQDLRAEAAAAADFGDYQQATSTAISLLQSGSSDHEKALEMIRSWPPPPASADEAGANFLRDMESGIRTSAISELAYSDPTKAKELLAQVGDAPGRNYAISGQIVNGLINEGKKDEALALINKTIGDFKQHASDQQAMEEYQSFAMETIGSMGVNANSIITPLIEQLKNQAPSEGCMTGTMKSGDKSIDLTCSEFNVINMIQSIPQMPGLINTTLGSFPSLKSKLDQAGGIDSIYTGGMNIMPKMPIEMIDTFPPNGSGDMTTHPVEIMPSPDQNNIGSGEGTNPVAPGFPPGFNGGMPPMPPGKDMAIANPDKLMRELKDKSETNPEFVKGKLKEAAKGRGGIDMLISLAMMANYEDSDLSSLALEIARPLLSQIESIESRAMTLQSLMSAYREVEGEVDADLMREGFALVDQLKEKHEKAGEPANQGGGDNDGMIPPLVSFGPGMRIMEKGMPPFMPSMPSMPMPPGLMIDGSYPDMSMLFSGGQADQLEAFLVSELAKDNYEKAIDYARSRKNEMQKLTCLIQIIQALSQQDF